MRKVFVALYENALRFAMFANMPVRMPFQRVLEQLIALNNRTIEGHTTGDDISPASEFNLYSWRQEEIPADSLIVEIPKPGIVMAVHRDAAKSIGSSSDMGVTMQLRRLLERGEGKAGERLQRFLQDPDAEFEALPYASFDVFVSYSTADLELARELVEGMQRRGLRCFLASRNLEAGRLWQEEIRQALVLSRVAVLVLTPASIRSSWVMCEAGA
ncbi:MAG: toll/interleukin-1 receptor domain-containing protein, partial [Bryobacteraceae bacterium]|nr:toll/interleukin-1 receptor domain-containing protein [Bryobacteraceae bacterium]